MLTIEFTASATEDLRYLRPFDQRIVMDAIDAQLAFEPTVETRNRKSLSDHPISAWELRVGNSRVFYDVLESELTVLVKAVGEKRRKKLYIRGVEFT